MPKATTAGSAVRRGQRKEEEGIAGPEKAYKPRLAQMVLRSRSLAGVKSTRRARETSELGSEGKKTVFFRAKRGSRAARRR